MGVSADNSSSVRRRPRSEPFLAEADGTAVAQQSTPELPAPAVSHVHGSLGNTVVQSALSGEGGWYADVATTVALDLVSSSYATDLTANHQVAARLQRHGTGHRSVNEVLATLPQSSGFGLSGEDLERFEIAFGHDFGHVKIHTDGVAAEAARALNAYAFALGGDLYFGSGNFAPGTKKGDRLLAHELTHVVQHDENRLPAPSSGDEQVSSPSDPTEREAYANEKVIMGRLDRIDRSGLSDGFVEGLPAAVDQRWSNQLGEAGEGEALGSSALWDAASALGGSAFAAEPTAPAGEAVVQQRSNRSRAVEASDVHEEAKRGTQTTGGKLPFWKRIQAAFGRYDISNVQGHTGSVAAKSSDAIGAQAYASGEDVVFGSTPDLHTAAHEVAHVIQQRGGVSLSDGLGQTGDKYEQHADRVADAVVAGQSAEPILAEMSGVVSGAAVQPGAVQRVDAGSQSSGGAPNRLSKIKELVGSSPTVDSVFDAYVATLRSDGFTYTSTSSKGTNVLNGSNSGACASIALGLKAAIKDILGETLSLEEAKNIFVPIDQDFIDPNCVGNIVNGRGFFFVKHYFVSGYDPTSGKKGVTGYSECEEATIYDWVHGFDIAVQQQHKPMFEALVGKVKWVKRHGDRFLLHVGEGNTYYDVGQSLQDIETLNELIRTDAGDVSSSAGAVQRKAPTGLGAMDTSDVRRTANQGTSGTGSKLPYAREIQKAFGQHDISGVRAHQDSRAAESASAIGAAAYAMGEDIAFSQTPDLHTAAHEAAHVIQQRAGISLAGGVGSEGDAYEVHADRVADAVVAGRSAEQLLDEVASPDQAESGGEAVQHKLELTAAEKETLILEVLERTENATAAQQQLKDARDPDRASSGGSLPPSVVWQAASGAVSSLIKEHRGLIKLAASLPAGADINVFWSGQEMSVAPDAEGTIRIVDFRADAMLAAQKLARELTASGDVDGKAATVEMGEAGFVLEQMYSFNDLKDRFKVLYSKMGDTGTEAERRQELAQFQQDVHEAITHAPRVKKIAPELDAKSLPLKIELTESVEAGKEFHAEQIKKWVQDEFEKALKEIYGTIDTDFAFSGKAVELRALTEEESGLITNEAVAGSPAGTLWNIISKHFAEEATGVVVSVHEVSYAETLDPNHRFNTAVFMSIEIKELLKDPTKVPYVVQVFSDQYVVRVSGSDTPFPFDGTADYVAAFEPGGPLHGPTLFGDASRVPARWAPVALPAKTRIHPDIERWHQEVHSSSTVPATAANISPQRDKHSGEELDPGREVTQRFTKEEVQARQKVLLEQFIEALRRE